MVEYSIRLSPVHIFIEALKFEFLDVICSFNVIVYSTVLCSLCRCYCRETSKDGRNLHVMYIDYGNTEWLEREKTIRLNNSYFELRPEGVLVKLAGKNSI